MHQIKSSKDNSGFATRTIENGTKITLTVGAAVIPAVLNDSKSAKALIARLPYTVRLQKYAHDYCGVMQIVFTPQVFGEPKILKKRRQSQ